MNCESIFVVVKLYFFVRHPHNGHIMLNLLLPLIMITLIQERLSCLKCAWSWGRQKHNKLFNGCTIIAIGPTRRALKQSSSRLVYSIPSSLVLFNCYGKTLNRMKRNSSSFPIHGTFHSPSSQLSHRLLLLNSETFTLVSTRTESVSGGGKWLTERNEWLLALLFVLCRGQQVSEIRGC